MAQMCKSPTPRMWQVVGRNFCTPTKTELTITRTPSNLKAGLFTITDASSGGVVYQVDRSGPTVKQILVLKDHAGMAILTMRPQDISTFHYRWKAAWATINDNKANTAVFTVKRSLSAGESFCAEVPDKATRDYYTIKACPSQRSYIAYTPGGTVAAQVTPKAEGKNKSARKNTCSIVVDKGFDLVFIAALVVMVECMMGE